MDALRTLLVFCLILIRWSFALNIKEHNGTTLYKALFKDYNKNVRPVFSDDTQVEVNITLELVKILQVDEINQTFKTTVNILISWFDEILTWNAKDYGKIEKLVFPLGENIWTPDLMNINAAYQPGALGQKYAFPILYNTGYVGIYMRVNLETQCEIHTKRFPLDIQRCDIKFSTFSSIDYEVKLRNNEDSFNLRNFIETAEWTIIENYVTSEMDEYDYNYTYRIISYHLTLKRTCTSCIMNNLVPVVILAMLNLLCFFVPTESGEKLTFPMSIFLTLAVFLTIIMMSLPESVDGVSYLSLFITFELALSASTLLFTVVTLRFHHEMGNTIVPPCARLMVKIFRKNRTNPFHTKKYDENILFSHEKMQGQIELNDNNGSVHGEVNKERICIVEEDIKWEYVSDAFDMMMFTIFLVIQIIALATFLTLIIM